MKKLAFALALALLAVVVSQPPSACAGGRDPVAPGSVLSGIAAAAFVTHVPERERVHAPSPAPVTCLEMPALAGEAQSAPVVICLQRVHTQPVPAMGSYLRHGFRPHLFGQYFVERGNRS